MKYLKGIAFLVSVAAFGAAFGAEEAAKKPAHKMAAPAAKHVVLATGDMKWGDAPPTLPAGAKLAVLDGNPGKPGPYTIRLQLPDGYKVMPHWHPKTENLTIISGEFHLATGDKFDDAKGDAMAAGSFGVMPPHMHHYAWAKGETVVQLHGTGPFEIIYVNAADDPSGMQGKKKAAPKKAEAKTGA